MFPLVNPTGTSDRITQVTTPLFEITRAALAAKIDFSVLAADATLEQVLEACAQAREYRFASVCVRPQFVSAITGALHGTDVKVCTVISFPGGTDSIADKLEEARQAIEDGAREIDWVFNHQNVAAMNNPARLRLVYEEVQDLAAFANDYSPVVVFKVIIETYLLDDNQKRTLCEMLARHFEDWRFFLKTSTGFAPARTPRDNTGATVEDVVLMLKVGRQFNSNVEVKASGGIKTLAAALAMINAGATRLGMGTAGALAVMREASEVGMD